MVNEEHFVGLCNPFSPCAGTYCVGCEDFFPVKEFVWDDTGEPLDEYRSRLKADAPGWINPLRWLSPVYGSILGGVIGHLIAPGAGTVVGAVLGIGAMSGIFVPVLVKLKGPKFYKIP